MSAFYVGQRVRVRCSVSFCDGQETFIRELGVIAYDGYVPYVGAEVSIPYNGGPKGWCVFEYHELEPILPEGMESLADTLALWLPEGELA